MTVLVFLSLFSVSFQLLTVLTIITGQQNGVRKKCEVKNVSRFKTISRLVLLMFDRAGWSDIRQMSYTGKNQNLLSPYWLKFKIPGYPAGYLY